MQERSHCLLGLNLRTDNPLFLPYSDGKSKPPWPATLKRRGLHTSQEIGLTGGCLPHCTEQAEWERPGKGYGQVV